MSDRKIKIRLVIELASVACLTVIFLVLFPVRLMVVDVTLALFALLLLALNVKFTKQVVWGQFPSPVPEPKRLPSCLTRAGILTAVGVMLCLMIGFMIGYHKGGWPGVWARVCNWHILVAIVFYSAWALLQQTLFQFYLLGRLLTFMPVWLAVVLTGVGFSLVHLPELRVTAATAGLGIIWSLLYYRYRRLAPIAVSHACLGAAFFYWVYGQDLALEWNALH